MSPIIPELIQQTSQSQLIIYISRQSATSTETGWGASSMNTETVLVHWSGSYFWKEVQTYWEVMLNKIWFKLIVTLQTRFQKEH